MGYLISKDPLNKGEFSVADTGFRALVKRKNLDRNKNFVLGKKSLGAFFEEAGYAAVPSNKNKKPGKTLVKSKFRELADYIDGPNRECLCFILTLII